MRAAARGAEVALLPKEIFYRLVDNSPLTRHAIQDLAAKVHSEAGRMTRLVEDILDLALIEEARPPAETLALDDVIADAVAKSQMLAETMGIPVTSECPQLSLRGDRRSLVSALANLVENAINYTAAKGTDPPEAVHVRARREGDRAVIEVEDHGIGIPERHQERIFERFYRVDRGRSRSRGGTGLGLAIVRHVVLNHRGELSVESVPGEGSKFRLELPLLES